ncbi:MAG: hypothetical protein RIQ93_2669 [Verrucomicrobiota bacterium]|jgi:hypothetical protein
MKLRFFFPIVILLGLPWALSAAQVAPYTGEREALIMRTPSPTGEAGWVLIPRVPAGATPAIAPRKSRAPTAQLRKDKDALVAVVNGHDLLAFNFGVIQPPRPGIDPKLARSGYIDGIRTRSGAVVSEAFPRVAADHEHQYALWSAWTATEFEGRKMNFWAPKAGDSQIRCEGVSNSWEAPMAAGFTAVNVFYDLVASPRKAALRETWNVVAYAMPEELKYDLFDVSLQQDCATASPVTVKKNAYGGFAMRYPDTFFGPAGRFMVSTGESNRAKANHTEQRWVYLGALVNGQPAGLAILSHPGNFRAPEKLRLHETMPYFVFAPAISGDFEITPTQPFKAHYRVVVFDGDPDRARLDRLWNAFASVSPVAAVGGQ